MLRSSRIACTNKPQDNWHRKYSGHNSRLAYGIVSDSKYVLHDIITDAALMLHPTARWKCQNDVRHIFMSHVGLRFQLTSRDIRSGSQYKFQYGNIMRNHALARGVATWTWVETRIVHEIRRELAVADDEHQAMHSLSDPCAKIQLSSCMRLTLFAQCLDSCVREMTAVKDVWL